MGEDHRAQQAEPGGDADGGLEGERLEEADREEEDGERLRRGVVLAGEEVGDEGLGDEAAAEAVEREQAAQPGDDAARAVSGGRGSGVSSWPTSTAAERWRMATSPAAAASG